jgi:hypothetical protein
MKRTVAVLVLGLLAAAVVRADVAPPKGLKRVTLDHKITTEKEYPDYIFFTIIGGGRAGPGGKNPLGGAEGVTQVKLDPKTPIVIPGAGRGAGIGRQGYLVAAPKDAGKSYGSEKEFLAAIRAGKVEGMIRAKTLLDSQATVKDTDTRTTVVQEYKLEKIDPKDGMVLTRVKEGEPEKKDGGKQEEEELDPATAFAPRGGVWVAGLSASLAVVLAGLWVVRRNRRSDL